jgi:hypothetical protein
MFPTVKRSVSRSGIQVGDAKTCILSCLSSPKSNFENYFPGLEIENYDQIRNPLNAQPKENIVAITEDKIDLSCDTSLKLKFPTISLPTLWNCA